MDYKRLLVVGLLGLSSIFSYGCPAVLIGAGGAAGAGTYAFIGGEITSAEEVGVDKAWEAAKKAMDELGFTITRKEKDAFDSQFELVAFGAAKKKIIVKLNRKSNAVTEIRIRVGMFGDENLSRSILEKIKKHF